MKFLLDEMLSGEIAAKLVSGGTDAVAVHELPALRTSEDDQVLAFAQAQGRALVTYDVFDLLEIHRTYVDRAEEHRGLILLTNRRFPQGRRATLGRIIKSLVALGQESDPGPSFVRWLQ